MEILRNDAIPVVEWMRLIEASPASTPFQTNGFYKLVRSQKGMTAEAIAVTEEGHIRSLAVVVLFHERGLKGFFSRRAIIFGGPLVESGRSDSADQLLGQVDLIVGNRVIYTETRNLSDYSDFKDLFARHSWRYIPYCNYRLNTVNPDLMAKAVSTSRMRQIRKALKSGVTWRVAESPEEVDLFYDMLEELYRTRVRKPLLPREFFQSFFRSNVGIYLLVIHEQKILGGIMCPILPSRAIYEFYVCGLDREYRELYPSIMATWAAMQYAGMNNIPLFDFMGAGSPDSDYGVRDFKAKFGGDLVEFGRFRKVNKPLLFAFGRAYIQLRSLLKV
ncbi:peptidoglycan bridge formation glycyltransferase FemA/FemB family protein [bacterium]|nr:peptidoglycan bridge formation glycyltransferase FemA/FemB family protein [bacterium]